MSTWTMRLSLEVAVMTSKTPNQQLGLPLPTTEMLQYLDVDGRRMVRRLRW